MQEKIDQVKNWLDKASIDLVSARRLATGPEPLFDTAIFHCQQAAEKALKGWLVFNDRRFDKTHDLRLLVSYAISIDPDFVTLQDAAERLTPYATAYRYPGDYLSPDVEEFDQAYADAAAFLSLVMGKFPFEIEKKF